MFPYLFHFFRRKGIEDADAHIKMDKDKQAEYFIEKFETELEKTKTSKGKVNIYKAIFSVFKAEFGINCMYGIGSEVLNIVNLFILRYFFAWIANTSHVNWHGYAYAILIGILSISSGLLRNHTFDKALSLGNCLRVCILGTLFKKLERLNQKSYALAGAGKLVTLASNDMIIIEKGAICLSFLIGAPFNVVITMVLIMVMFDWIVALVCFVLYLVIIGV